MLMTPQGIPDTHWLHRPEYKWFVDGYYYATTQNQAIPALSRVPPGELYHAVTAIMRGAKIPEPKKAKKE